MCDIVLGFVFYGQSAAICVLQYKELHREGGERATEKDAVCVLGQLWAPLIAQGRKPGRGSCLGAWMGKQVCCCVCAFESVHACACIRVREHVHWYTCSLHVYKRLLKSDLCLDFSHTNTGTSTELARSACPVPEHLQQHRQLAPAPSLVYWCRLEANALWLLFFSLSVLS